MQKLPHHYAASASAETQSHVVISSEGVPSLDLAAPPEFGGPGGIWSPETLLVSTVATCFVLTFRAIALGSQLDWTSLRCDASGTLDKREGAMQFTHFELTAQLTVPAGTDAAKTHRLLEKAERHCLITNSLKAEVVLSAKVQFAD